MARPSKPEKRDQQLNLSLTRREFEWLCARAATYNMKPVIYGRLQVLNDRPLRAAAVGRGHLDPLFLVQLSRLGNNLNQATRQLHLIGLAAPESLEPLLADIHRLIRKGASDDS